MQALPPNIVRRRACRTSFIAVARTCVHHLPGNLLAAVRLTLKSQCVTSSAPADETDTLFNVLFSTFAILIVFSRFPFNASCVVTATASGPSELGCSALFSSALSSLITTSPPVSSLLLVRVASWVSPVLSSPVTSAVSLTCAPEPYPP